MHRVARNKDLNSKNRMNILVLGSKGVVGEAVTKILKSKGHRVIEWDIKIDSSHDLRIRHSLYFILKENPIDFAIFLAFDVGGSKYKVDSHEYISNNMRLMDYTFESLSAFKVPFIHSTSQMSNMDHDPYGPLKRIGEFYTEYLGGVNVKIWNVYGPEEVNEKSHVINDFIHQAHMNKCIQMMTSGKETRQFLHGEDFAKALIKIIENFESLRGKP
jgi:nucleoside-diphosphate-sugar epimerase